MKLTQEDFTKVQEAIKIENTLASQLGALEFQLTEMKKTKNQLMDSMSKILQQRTELLKSFKEKYGEGTLNVDTGEFTVTK